MACMPSGIESGSTFVRTSATHVAAPRNDNAESAPSFDERPQINGFDRTSVHQKRWPPRELDLFHIEKAPFPRTTQLRDSEALAVQFSVERTLPCRSRN
jgi:hypothetical protein